MAERVENNIPSTSSNNKYKNRQKRTIIIPYTKGEQFSQTL